MKRSTEPTVYSHDIRDLIVRTCLGSPAAGETVTYFKCTENTDRIAAINWYQKSPKQ